MNSRIINVSADNVRSWIETGLRSLGAIDDNETVNNLSLVKIVNGLDMKKNKLPVIQIDIEYCNDRGVELIKLDGA